MKRLCVQHGCSYGRENGFLCDKHDQCPIFKSGTPQECLKAYREAEKPKERKYHNEKITIDGIVFDSKKEVRRYYELKFLEKAGKITDLKRQVKYVLIPAQYEGKKCVFRACCYVADYVYKQDGKDVVEDCKGIKTEVYMIKKKLMYFKYGILIKES